MTNAAVHAPMMFRPSLASLPVMNVSFEQFRNIPVINTLVSEIPFANVTSYASLTHTYIQIL